MADKPHRCSICGKSFDTAAELREHEKACKTGSH